jgi:hypothetical protein
MVVDVDLAPLIGVSVTLAVAVVGAWWGMAKMFVSQFEKRQNERFDGLQLSITEQKKELDGHMTRQDGVMLEMRRLEDKLASAQVEAAMKFQTKDDAGKQFSQLVQEIRGLGSRIDSLHGRFSGMPGSQ